MFKLVISTVVGLACLGAIALADGGTEGVGELPTRLPTPGIAVTLDDDAASGLLVVSHDLDGGVIDSDVTDSDGTFVVDAEEGGSIDVIGTPIVAAPIEPGEPVLVVVE